MDAEKTKVVFRVWKGKHKTCGDNVLALFPEDDAGQYPGQYCGSYEHIGQHGGADYHGCIARTRPAKPKEYKALAAELKDIGYNLQVIKRWTRRS